LGTSWLQETSTHVSVCEMPRTVQVVYSLALSDASQRGSSFLLQCECSTSVTICNMAIEYRGEKFAGYNKPKRTPGAKKSHAVLAKEGSTVKLIRFGQQGVQGSPDGSARNKAFKARHAKNIAKGKMSAAYWANKVKW